MEKTYTHVLVRGEHGVTGLYCTKKEEINYHPDDVEQRYCLWCHTYIRLNRQLEKPRERVPVAN